MAAPALLHWTLVLLLSLAVSSSSCYMTGNLALNAPTVLSSTWGGEPEHAVDGVKRAENDFFTCTHTESEEDPWWRVDLSRPYNITMVTITNRKDCCERRINGAQIRIGNSLENHGNNNMLAAEITSIRRGESKTFRFDPVEGRYVNIFLPGKEKILTLCEVEVFAGSEDNLALQKLATQSSVFHGTGFSKFAVDGDRNSNYNRKPCAHSVGEDNPWWRVDLGKSFHISQVTITNRVDCCAERIEGTEIRVGDSLFNNGNNNTRAAVIQHMGAGETREFNFQPIRGRYVNLLLPGQSKMLTVCEVEVYARLDRNVASRGRATQSSLILGEMASFGHALNAIDGNANPDVRKGSCSMTERETDPWWRLDLLDGYSVTAVALTNPKAGSPKGLNGAQIYIGDSTNPAENSLCAKVTFVPLGETVRFDCLEERVGQYVTVMLPGEGRSLSLCEVQVFGIPASTHQSNNNA
ncbi:uncharacterized protein LOC134462286 [Engraulis encrasicolus]|uniref:uncharacterized protein LOC134462286 n=1 Tax=Engraulis encrasicolus TaxID=184585 RepID=UPI002FD0326B